MSPSEIGFLALGLALGVTAGVALVAVMRPRSPLRPVVKVTVTPQAMMPRELARIPARGRRLEGPVPGSPEDDALGDPPAPALSGPAAARPATPALDSRTDVPFGPAPVAARAVGIPIVGGGRPAPGPLATAAPPVTVADRPSGPMGAAPLVRPAAYRSALAVRTRPPAPDARPSLAPDPVAIPIVAGRSPGGRASKPAATGRAAEPDACADERAHAGTACEAADAARDAARGLADRLRDARRGEADLQARVEEAGTLADPRRLAAEKERLHARFRAAHGATATADEAEAAARDWLTAVSTANTAAQDAARRVQSGTEELRQQAAALEKLDLEANAARVAAERAEDACRAAREALAACEERQRPVDEGAGEGPGPLDEHWPGGPEPGLDRASESEHLPLILLVLRGDKGAREELVADLAAGDASAVASWHVRIADFVDAATARAIEDGFLDTDADNPFWRLFSPDEQHEIVQALSALGFRFDGIQGFADDRAPTARDLSLAVGYAGLDRMRIRSWPGEAALAGLFEGATVRADMWLATQADDLSLGRVEAALGGRAAALADLWDTWGRVRPAMLRER